MDQTSSLENNGGEEDEMGIDTQAVKGLMDVPRPGVHALVLALHCHQVNTPNCYTLDFANSPLLFSLFSFNHSSRLPVLSTHTKGACGQMIPLAAARSTLPVRVSTTPLRVIYEGNVRERRARGRR